MIYDAGKIIPGILILLLLLASPLLYTIVNGRSAARPQLEMASGGTECVESAGFMRRNHMNLLKNTWRESVVRRGQRTYVSSTGRSYQMSLTRTCLGCHPNKAKFCDQCHNYVASRPRCWTCHNIPEGRT